MKKIRFSYIFFTAIICLAMWSCEDTPPPSNNPVAAIGDTYQGGIVFYLDGTGQHGLVCAPTDQNIYVGWRSGAAVLTNATNTPVGQGASNTALIVSAQGAGSYAAKICDDLSLGGYDDWFLPCRDELALMKTNLKNAGLGNFANSGYWTSTEYTLTQALIISFLDGGVSIKDKSEGWHVRAVRAF